jgi:3-deoxy-manno-octulosonate cytidylyltransferase (CMP-KDO synthetase)
MRIIGVIPARYQSKRFPGKVLAILKGKTMIECLYRQAQKAKVLDEIIVATDDDRVVKAVQDFGGVVRKVTGDFRSGSDRVAFLAKDIEADIFLNIQADEPLMPPEVMVETVKPFADPEVLMTTAGAPILSESEWSDTNIVKMVVDRFGDALYFTRAPVPYERDNQGRFPKKAAYKHLGIYGFRRGFLLKFSSWPTGVLEEIEHLEQLRAQENGFKIRTVITPFDSQCVDTPEDLARLNAKS